MQYIEMPYVKNQVSKIVFGSAIQPFLDGTNQNELLDAVYEMGVTTIDTARVYGDAEISLGKWIYEKNMRDKIVLLSKCGHHDLVTGEKRVNEKEMRRDFEASSNYLKTDYIDIYVLHRDDPDMAAGEIVEIFNAMHAEGKIGAFGGSNWTHQRIEEANEYAYKHNLIPFTVSSPNFGLAEMVSDPWGGGCVSISGPQNAEVREWYKKNNISVFAYASLAHGLFSGRIKSTEPEKADLVMDEAGMKGFFCEANMERLRRCEELAAKKGCTVPQLAMAWILKQDLNVCALVGTSNIGRMKENVAALDIPLTAGELGFLDLR